MPSDKPLPDRCGASVTEKVGLEVHASDLSVTVTVEADRIDESFSLDDIEFDLDVFEEFVSDEETGRRTSGARSVDDYQYHLDSEVIETVSLAREDDEHAEPVDEEADFNAVMQYMRSGFDLVGMHLECTADHPAISGIDLEDAEVAGVRVHVDVDVGDDDPYVRNAGTELQGYCLRYPMDNGRCYVHGGANPGPEEGNTHAMTHGLRAKRSNFYNSLDDEDKAFVDAMVDSWLEDAPFERDNAAKVNELYRVAIDQLRLWFAVDEYVDDDGEVKTLAYEQVVGLSDSGQPITAEQANPVNLEYSRLDRDVHKKLKELGLLDDPDSQSADAQMSLAQKLSGLSDDE